MQEKDNKEYISPEKPADLLTCSAYIARDLVAQYFKMKVLNMRDAVALYIISGYVDFKRDGKAFFESEASTARALGLEDVQVRRTVGDLIEAGFITRDGKNGDKLQDRPWNVPILKPDNGETVGAYTVPQSDGGPSPRATDTVSQSDGGTVPHSDGLLKESGSEEKKKRNQIGRKGKKSPACLGVDSSFKIKSEPEIQTQLDSFPWGNYILNSPDGLAGCWTLIIGIFNPPSGAMAGRDEGSAEIIDPMDIRRAYKILEQMEEYGDPDTIRNWIEWYIKTGGLKKSLWLSEFSYSWETYKPFAIEARKAMIAEEEKLRAEERRIRLERERREEEEQEKIWEEEEKARLERQKADEETQRQKDIEAEEVRRQKAIEEEEARKKRAAEEMEAKRLQAEVFMKSLPSPEATRLAVNAVPVPLDWLDNYFGYHRFMGAMLRSVPVLRFADIQDPMMYHYPYIARDAFGGDPGAFEQKSRDFVVAEVEHVIAELKAKGEPSCPNPEISWKRFARFFGIPEEARYERPKTLVAVGAEGGNESPFGEKDEEDD